MNTIKKTVIVLFLILGQHLPAQENAKIAIAITDFSVSNTRESFARTCEIMLAENLFQSGMFTLMDKRQMDEIARKNGFSDYNTLDPQQLTRLGKILRVDKIITGSITFDGTYIIEVRSVNTSTGTIDIIITKKTGNSGNIERIIYEITTAIERHYSGYEPLSGDFDISVKAAVMSPVGFFDKEAGTGFGCIAGIIINNPYDMPFALSLETGYLNFTSDYNSIQSINFFPVTAGISKAFIPASNLRLIPGAGFGYIFSIIRSDDRDAIFANQYKFVNHYYYNPALTASLEFDILVYDRWYFLLTPQYTVFFDGQSRTGQFLSLNLGIRMLF